MSVRELAAPPQHSVRRHVQFILDLGHAAGFWGAVYEVGFIVLIIANVVAAILSTVPSLHDAARVYFDAFEAVSVAIFTLEYAARLWSAPDDPRFTRSSPLAARLRMAVQPMVVIDLLSFAPAYVALFVPVLDLRILRIFRLLRLLKIARYSPALATFGHVIATEKRALMGTLLLLVCIMCFSAYAMYLAESEVQPKLFGTVPDAMWWAITTLTTVGYGDAVPVTTLGKLVAGVTMIMGIGLFALPVGILATGFMHEIHRRDFVVSFGMLSRTALFQGLDTHIIGDVMGALRSQIAGADTRILPMGAHPETMFFIVSGDVEIDRPDGRRRLGPGDFFGEMEILEGKPHTASASARSRSQLLILTAEDFRALMRKHEPLRARIQRHAEDKAKTP